VARLRIQDCERSIAVANDDPFGGRVDADIVSIAAKRDSSGALVVVSVKRLHGSVPSVGHEQRVRRWLIAHALGLSQTCDRAQHVAAGDVNDADAVIAELSDKEALSFQIECHVIDPAAYIAKRNLGFEL
jgi:hypothetical protein